MPPAPDETTCLVAGGGPAGIVLGPLLARAGVNVTVSFGGAIHQAAQRMIHADVIAAAVAEGRPETPKGAPAAVRLVGRTVAQRRLIG